MTQSINTVHFPRHLQVTTVSGIMEFAKGKLVTKQYPDKIETLAYVQIKNKRRKTILAVPKTEVFIPMVEAEGVTAYNLKLVSLVEGSRVDSVIFCAEKIVHQRTD